MKTLPGYAQCNDCVMLLSTQGTRSTVYANNEVYYARCQTGIESPKNAQLFRRSTTVLGDSDFLHGSSPA